MRDHGRFLLHPVLQLRGGGLPGLRQVSLAGGGVCDQANWWTTGGSVDMRAGQPQVHLLRK